MWQYMLVVCVIWITRTNWNNVQTFSSQFIHNIQSKSNIHFLLFLFSSFLCLCILHLDTIEFVYFGWCGSGLSISIYWMRYTSDALCAYHTRIAADEKSTQTILYRLQIELEYNYHTKTKGGKDEKKTTHTLTQTHKRYLRHKVMLMNAIALLASKVPLHLLSPAYSLKLSKFMCSWHSIQFIFEIHYCSHGTFWWLLSGSQPKIIRCWLPFCCRWSLVYRTYFGISYTQQD